METSSSPFLSDDDFQATPPELKDVLSLSKKRTLQVSPKECDAPEKPQLQRIVKRKRRIHEKNSLILTTLNREQLDYLVARIKRNWKVFRPSTTSHVECYRSTLSLDGRRGYPKSLRLTNKLLRQSEDPLLSDIDSKYSWNAAGVMLVDSGKLPENATDEASHLCNHPWCVNPEHLVWESPKKNYSRKNCNTHFECECGKVSNPCTHSPQCLDLFDCTCDWHKKES
jgi:hypothetical protein